MSFEGKVVIITGASSGIGAEAAIHFATVQKASVVIVARNADKLQEVADKCMVNGAVKALIIVADVTKDARIIIDKTIAHFGQLDVLVNNAGIGGSGMMEDVTSMDQYDSIMDTNTRSVYYLSVLAIPHLLKTQGNIVNVSSVAGLRSFPNVAAYCMSKGALDQLTRCLSLELGTRGVRVNSVNPGLIVTNFHYSAGMDDAAYQQFLECNRSTHALGRVGSTDEVTGAIVFLANNSVASFITGAFLSVDGGKANICPR